MTGHSRGLRVFASMALVSMTCVGLASCGGGGTRSVTASGGDEMIIMPPSTTSPPQSAGTPDLTVGSPSVDDAGPETGASFTLSATVSNTGDAAAPATTLRWYRSTDAAIATSDTVVGTDALVGALAASGTGSASVDLTAPSTAGTYYYGACVDAVTDESDTTNNCSASVQVDVAAPQQPGQGGPVTPQQPGQGGPVTPRQPGQGGPVTPPLRPDVAPLGVFLESGTLGGGPGRSFTLRSIVRNHGDAASPATELRFYRSRDGTITTSDNELGSFGVGPLAASGGTGREFPLSLTAPSAPGTYYYGVCVDAVTGESDTTNNCSASLTVTVDGTPPPPPDLYVASLSLSDYSLDAGEEFWILALVFNQGDGGSAATTVRFYRSDDATITTSDTEIGTRGIGALGFSDAAVLTLSAPSTPGTYYYGACVDPVPRESDTTNNCSGSRVLEVD